MLTAKRDKAAALRFFDKAMQASGVPEKVMMDKSGANKAAMDEINGSGETPIIERPSLIDRIGSGAVVALGGGKCERRRLN